MSSATAPYMDDFAFPPTHSFPPFFTLQRNAQTLASQLAQWTKLVLEFCRHYQIFTLDCDGAWERANGRSGLFGNAKIDRQLSREALQVVLKAMVDQGDAAWDPPLPGKQPKGIEAVGNSVLVFWRRPEEWGDRIYTWVTRTGQNGSIMTFFELTEGDLVQAQDFHKLPIPLLRLALATLEKQGKAKVFEGSEEDGMSGVKFA